MPGAVRKVLDWRTEPGTRKREPSFFLSIQGAPTLRNNNRTIYHMPPPQNNKHYGAEYIELSKTDAPRTSCSSALDHQGNDDEEDASNSNERLAMLSNRASSDLRNERTRYSQERLLDNDTLDIPKKGKSIATSLAWQVKKGRGRHMRISWKIQLLTYPSLSLLL